MNKITVLDEVTANQIAAGEVVERPVSVVKELVENSLDAGANRVTVELIQGGISSIKVVDNGYGMTSEDALLCFQRHATSKIRWAEDLNKILTLGFRGEALPSIASVSKVTLITRTEDNLAGTEVVVEAGQVKDVLPAGCPIGTTVEVKELFYNTPARRKYLKSANAEAGQVSDLMSRLSLARPDVRFELRSGGKVIFFSPGNGSIKDTAASVFGADNVRSMLEVNHQGELLTINGLISKPVLTRASRQYQNFFINKRYIRSSLISSALQQAYQSQLPSGRFPIAVLHINLDPTQVDVNVHPTKMEVRLAREKEVQEELLEALSLPLNLPEAITGLWEIMPGRQNKHNVNEELTSAGEQEQAKTISKTEPVAPVPGLESNKDRVHGYNLSNNTTRDQLSLPIEIKKTQVPVQYKPEKFITQDKPKEVNVTASPKLLENKQDYTPENNFPSLTPVGQVLPTYVLAQGDDGLYIIDQHAAHERVLYEKHLNQLQQSTQSQMLLEPITLELPHHEAQLVIKHVVEFSELGFILEHFGGDTFLLRGVPTRAITEPKEIFIDLLTRLQDGFAKKLDRGIVIDHLAATMACKDAIKAGKHLGNVEVKALLEGLACCQRPYTCPHGRPTLINITHEELNKRFKR